MTVRTWKLWVGTLLAAGLPAFVPAGDPGAYIPQSADAAVFVRLDRIRNFQGLKTLATSGEVSDLSDPLAKLGIPERGVAVAFFGTRERLLISEAPSAVDVEKQLRQRHANQPHIVIDRKNFAGHPGLKVTILTPKKREFYADYEAVWLANDIVAIGSDDRPLPRHALGGPTSDQYRTLSAGGTLAAARIVHPANFKFDVMGLAKQLREIDLDAIERGDGLDIRGQAAVTDPDRIRETAKLFDSAVKILLVSLFGAQPELYEQLATLMKIEVSGSEITFSISLERSLLCDIEKYYAAHAEMFRNMLNSKMTR